MDQFDPYHKWLGIPRAEQPANHYRLLGITVFESDLEVIEAAADRQMKYVSQCAMGQHLKLSQKLLNELSGARVCLLVPARKQAYDSELSAKLNEALRIEESLVPVPLTEPEPMFVPNDVNVASTSTKPKRTSGKRRSKPPQKQNKRRLPPWGLIGIGGGAAVLCIGLVLLLGPRSSRSDKPKEVAVVPPAIVNVPPPPLNPPPSNPKSSDTKPSEPKRFNPDIAAPPRLSLPPTVAEQTREAFEAAVGSRDRLKVNPDDPAANLKWGLFVCFHEQDWERGLKLLAKADDDVWAPLARRELASSPKAEDWLQLGDDWLRAGGSEQDPVRSSTMERADRAWQHAISIAGGDQRKEVEQQVDDRIVKLFGASFATTTGNSEGAPIPDSEGFSPTESFTIEFWFATTALRGTLLSKRHTQSDATVLVHLDNGVPNLSFSIGGGEYGGGGGPAINDGKWHHIAIVKQGADSTLFVDGAPNAHFNEKNPLDSLSPWKFGTSFQRMTITGRFGGYRISKSARYHGTFVPKKTYPADRETLLPKTTLN